MPPLNIRLALRGVTAYMQDKGRKSGTLSWMLLYLAHLVQGIAKYGNPTSVLSFALIWPSLGLWFCQPRAREKFEAEISGTSPNSVELVWAFWEWD